MTATTVMNNKLTEAAARLSYAEAMYKYWASNEVDIGRYSGRDIELHQLGFAVLAEVDIKTKPKHILLDCRTKGGGTSYHSRVRLINSNNTITIWLDHSDDHVRNLVIESHPKIFVNIANDKNHEFMEFIARSDIKVWLKKVLYDQF